MTKNYFDYFFFRNFGHFEKKVPENRQFSISQNGRPRFRFRRPMFPMLAQISENKKIDFWPNFDIW